MKPIAGAVTLTDQAVSAIRDAILSGELGPGRLYSVYQLAETLGISRTPVREALLRLAQSGMVRIERNRGFHVLRRDAREIAEIFHLRLLLEVPAAHAAAQVPDRHWLDGLRSELVHMREAAASGDEPRFMLHDRRFHECVLSAAGNATLTGIVNGLRDNTVTLGASTAGTSRPLADIAEEHSPVLDALAGGTPDDAAQAVRRHLLHTAELLLAQLGAQPADLAMLREVEYAYDRGQDGPHRTV